MPQSAYGHNMWDGLERLTTGGFENLLIPVWLPAMPEVQDKLERGAQVADVGCGRGKALIKLAQAFPRSASSNEDLNEVLSRQNNNLASRSVTATPFLQERHIALPERAQSASEQRVSAQAAQQAATVATWAKDVWEKHATIRTAQAVQQAATVATSSSLPASISTTGALARLGMRVLEQKRLEIERGPGGDHDTPYLFTLPISMKERLAWARLQTRVQAGELPA